MQIYIIANSTGSAICQKFLSNSPLACPSNWRVLSGVSAMCSFSKIREMSGFYRAAHVYMHTSLSAGIVLCKVGGV